MFSPRTGDVAGPWVIDRVLSFGSPTLATGHRSGARKVKVTLKISERRGMAEAHHLGEVRALSSFEHRAIPQLVDSGPDDDGPLYIAMRPFEAETLADRLVGGAVEWHLACAWLYEIATALQHVHKADWVHRGVAPHAIYVGSDARAWLLGYQDALPRNEAKERAQIPQTNLQFLAYMAPEVLADATHDPRRADLYAFGCVAHEMLSGASAFPAAAWGNRDTVEVRLLEWKTRAKELDPGPDVPDWLRALVRKCTHPMSELRLPDMDTVVAFLDGARNKWEQVEVRETPELLSRHELPPLTVQPALMDTDALATAIAERTAGLQHDSRRTGDDLLVIVAASLGVAAGLAISVLSVFFVELAMLA